jgi:hypothetical protein
MPLVFDEFLKLEFPAKFKISIYVAIETNRKIGRNRVFSNFFFQIRNLHQKLTKP